MTSSPDTADRTDQAGEPSAHDPAGGPPPHDPTPHPDVALAEEVVRAFFQVTALMEQHYDRRSAEFGLSSPEALALQRIEQGSSMSELAGCLACHPSRVTGIVDRLESRGLVERRTVAGDRRVKHLVVTAAGRALREEHRLRLHDRCPLTHGLPARELRGLRELFQRIAATGVPADPATETRPARADATGEARGAS